MAKGLRSKIKRHFRTVKRCDGNERRRSLPPQAPAAVPGGRGGGATAAAAPASTAGVTPPGRIPLCRETLEQAPWQVEAEKKKQEILQQILAAPRPSETAGGSDAADTAGPSGMAVDLAGGDGQQEQQGEDVAAPAAGTSNGKLLKRLRKERLLKVPGAGGAWHCAAALPRPAAMPSAAVSPAAVSPGAGTAVHGTHVAGIPLLPAALPALFYTALPCTPLPCLTALLPSPVAACCATSLAGEGSGEGAQKAQQATGRGQPVLQDEGQEAPLIGGWQCLVVAVSALARWFSSRSFPLSPSPLSFVCNAR